MLGAWWVLALGARAQADWGYPEDSNAVVLTAGNHDRFVAAFEEAVVYYALPDCDHCTTLDQPFAELAFEYKERDRRVPFARLDCKRHLDFCRGQAIPSYPFLRLFLRGHSLVYQGARTREALRDFIDATLSRAPATLTADQLADRLQSTDLSVVFVGQHTQRGYHLLDLACRQEAAIKFFHVEPAAAAGHALFADLDLPEQGRFFVFRGTTATPCEAADELRDVDKCLHEVQHPALIELGAGVVELLRQEPQRWMFYFGRDWDEPQLSDFEQFANDHRKQLIFVVALASTAPADLLRQFGDALLVAEGGALPQVRLAETTFGLEGLVRYALDGPVNQAALRALHRGASERTLPSLLRGEDFEQRPLGRLTAVSARSFERLVPSAERDAAVLYHADFESHAPSRDMLAALEQLAAAPLNADVAFFALNADLNELRAFSSPHRPLLLLVSRRDPARPRLYTGPPSAEGLQAFLTARRGVAKEPVDLGASSSEL